MARLRSLAECTDSGLKKMHIHRRAHRYMEKMFIRDLWKEWRRASGQPSFADKATKRVPALAA